MAKTTKKKSPKSETIRIGKSNISVTAISKAAYNLVSNQSYELRNLFVSTDTTTNVQKAMQYRHSDELIQQLVETKLDFLVAGFSNHCSVNKSKSFYDAFAAQYDLDQLITELADDIVTTDNAILHWKVDKETGDVEYVMTLDPGYVEYTNAMGQETMKIVLDKDTLKSILDSQNAGKTSRIPPKYLDAIKKGGKVELSNADGEYWMVLTTGRKYRGLVNPSMAAIFADLKLRAMFIDGDWSTAFFAKAFIQLIKSGEAIEGGQYAGSKRNYQTKAENAALNDLFKDVSRALRIVGNHTLKIEHVVPPKEAYAHERYGPVETRVYRWAGIPKVLIEGEGGNYSSGFLGKTKLVADIRRKRRLLSRFIEKFYKHETINRNNHKITPAVRFNEQVLKTPDELLKELEALMKNATGFSSQSFLEALGYESETEWERKKAELVPAILEILLPVYEPSQGLLGTPGRPGDSQTDPVSKGRGGRVDADFSSDDFHHIEVPGVSGEIVGSKTLSNGIVLRFAKQKDGKTKTKIVLVPKSMLKGLKEAKAYVKKHYSGDMEDYNDE